MAFNLDWFNGLSNQEKLAYLVSASDEEFAQIKRDNGMDTAGIDRNEARRDRQVTRDNNDARDKQPEKPSSLNPDRREGTLASPSDSNQQSQIAQPETPRTRADASRDNGSKSRGPVTQEGKDRSRYGAWKHGLTAATVLGSPAELERFHHFTVGLKNDLEPKGVLEITLIESLATAQWQFDRCRANEINIQFEAATKYMEETPEGHDETIAWARAQARAMEEKSIVLDRIGRYGARHHRQMLQIFDCFQKTKRDRINGEYAEIRENKKKHNQALAKHQQAAASGEPRPTGRGPSGSEPRPTGRGPSGSEPRPTGRGPSISEPRPTGRGPSGSEPRPTGRGPSNQSNQPGKPAPGFVCPDPEPDSSKDSRA